jgi:pyridoxamine 5'-phosphate oxidase
MSDSYTDYHTLHRKIWNELDKAILDRSHGWRTPVLATIDHAGHPDARTVVLRKIHPENQKLTIYTDKRSPKISQISNHPDVALVFWCAHLNW